MEEKPQTSSTSLSSHPVISSETTRWTVKILILLIALVVFQIPLFLVKDLSDSRHRRCQSVQTQIAETWGNEQLVSLSVPAEKEKYQVHLEPQMRYRGIYQTVVYTAKVNIAVEHDLSAETDELIMLNNTKNVTAYTVKVNGRQVPVKKEKTYLQFTLPAGKSDSEISITLKGSKIFDYAPNAKHSSFILSGNWKSPGFTGNKLPDYREISEKSFSAQWINNNSVKEDRMGVELYIPAGTYLQVERCINYATFFIIVFFFSLVAAELFTKTRIHTLQYIVAAGAPVLFYLMTLTFSEKIGFTAGYITSAAIIVAMITMYARMFLGKLIPALMLGTVVAISYLFNFLVLRMEDSALLTGTIALAIVLGLLMAATGKINRLSAN